MTTAGRCCQRDWLAPLAFAVRGGCRLPAVVDLGAGLAGVDVDDGGHCFGGELGELGGEGVVGGLGTAYPIDGTSEFAQRSTSWVSAATQAERNVPDEAQARGSSERE